MRKTINSDAIKSALAEQGLTQKELAKTVGVSSQAVTNWLKGKDFPRPPALLKLATILRLTFEQMVEIVDTGKPVVAFRKKGNAKTTAAHIAKAMELGQLLKPLVPYLPELQSLRTRITSPSVDYHKLQIAVAQTRARLGIGEQAVLEYKHLIGEFKKAGAILVPVLWGEKQRHENALHICLPAEDVTFIFLNLDTRLEDFKFWMAHELAHVYTPQLAGREEGEDFADAFAGALLFPRSCAEVAYRDAFAQTQIVNAIRALQKHAEKHMVSLNTVYQEIRNYAKATGLTPLRIDEKHMHAVRNSRPGPLVSKTLFDPAPPPSERYIAACKNVFRSEFFSALKRMIQAQDTGASYVQQVMDASIHDGRALYEELRH